MEHTEVIRARGHENVQSTHASTFEVTSDDWLTPAGDCILAIEADRTPPISPTNSSTRPNPTTPRSPPPCRPTTTPTLSRVAAIPISPTRATAAPSAGRATTSTTEPSWLEPTVPPRVSIVISWRPSQMAQR